MRSLGGDLIQCDWCSYEKRVGHSQAQWEDGVRRHGGNDHPHVKERVLEESVLPQALGWVWGAGLLKPQSEF